MAKSSIENQLRNQYNQEVSLINKSKPVTTVNKPNNVDPYEQFLLDWSSGKFSSGGSPGAYFGQAQNMLGGMDTSGFDQLRAALEQSTQQNQATLKSSFDQLLENLQKQGKENKQEFASARGTIMEDSFSRNRDLYRNLAARGLGASGLQQLGGIQNRMETGKQVSNVAGQFYDAAEKLADAQEQGTESYNQQSAQIENNKNSALAQIQQQEIQYRNAYQQQVASLALQLQQAAQESAQMSLSARAELAKYQSEKIKNTSEMAKIDIVSQDIPDEMKAAKWADTFNVPIEQARIEMTKYNNAYSDSLVQEFLTPFSARLGEAETFEDVNAVMKTIIEQYQAGVLDKSDIQGFLQKNYRKIADPNLWLANGRFAPVVNALFLDSGRTSIAGNMGYMGLNENSQSGAIQAILDYYKVK